MEKKNCYICKQDKPLSEFYIHWRLGQQHYCKICTKEKVRLNGQTLNGLIRKIYRNQKHNAIRRGMSPPTYPFEWFNQYLLSSGKFLTYFREWTDAGCPRHLTPSVDRIDNNISYTTDNIQIMTWGENKNKEHQAVINGDNTKNCKGVVGVKISDGKVYKFHSMRNAEAETGVDFRNVSACCRGLRKSGMGFKFMYEEDYNG